MPNPHGLTDEEIWPSKPKPPRSKATKVRETIVASLIIAAMFCGLCAAVVIGGHLVWQGITSNPYDPSLKAPESPPEPLTFTITVAP